MSYVSAVGFNNSCYREKRTCSEFISYLVCCPTILECVLFLYKLKHISNGLFYPYDSHAYYSSHNVWAENSIFLVLSTQQACLLQQVLIQRIFLQYVRYMIYTITNIMKDDFSDYFLHSILWGAVGCYSLSFNGQYVFFSSSLPSILMLSIWKVPCLTRILQTCPSY